MRFVYKSPIGTINIVRVRDGSFSIVIDGDYYGRYSSPIHAADDVYTFTTGCDKWDIHGLNDEMMLSVPTDIYEWIRQE